MPIGKSISIKGPYGKGVSFNINQNDGLITFICAGTGILPLIDFLFQLYISLRIASIHKNISFSIKLIASFTSSHHYPGRLLIESLLALKSS
jgi:predicted ferric reductase